MKADARFGLVLGAGGPLAWVYHLGVVEGLRESGLVEPGRAGRFVGTSGGAAIAAALVAGTSTEAFLAALAEFDPQRVGGATGTSALQALPIGHADGWHDTRLWITAVRVRDGVTVVFGRDVRAGTVGDAVEASSAIPVVFAPKLVGGERYVDGAVASPTHADLLIDDQHDLIIVSAPMARSGGGWLRAQARRRLVVELGRLQRAGRQTLVFIPDARVSAVAHGYPYVRREARHAIVDAARQQVLDEVSG